MTNPFFDRPILNSPYAYPRRHWELDEAGQPTQKIVELRRSARFITPIPKPKKRKAAATQAGFVFDEGKGLSSKEQEYDPTSIINEVRGYVDAWRALPNPSQWQVTPETACLLQHWRQHEFSGVRPFFCQVEAAETAIWLTEVAPQSRNGKRILDHLAAANTDANPQLMRLALKLATGAGKTTVMAMLIAWQSINAARHKGSRNFTRGFLICAPGLTIRDRLRVLLPNDPESYYASRELVPNDMLDAVNHAKIVITNFHAFRLRERIELSKGGRALLQGRTGEELDTQETEGQMLQRVMPDLMGMKNILVVNDEAHHCYREKPKEADDEDLKGEARVLLTTFSDTLASALRAKLRRLLGNEPRLAERIDVHSLNAIGLRLYKAHVGQATIAGRKTAGELIREAAGAVGGHKFGQHFLLSEWEQVVDAWQLASWEAYRDVARLGRKTRLPEAQRKVLWSIFERVRAGLQSRRLITYAGLFTSLASALSKSGKVVFDFAVVDEAQDISVAHLRFLAALGSARPNALVFAGDLGQRIFQQPFSWKALGVDIRGRSRTLRVNYRTSHQIRTQADRLLGPVVTDVDGNRDDRSDTVSVFNGPAPTITALNSESEEIKTIADWIGEHAKTGMLPHEIGLFVRSEAQLHRAQAAVKRAGLPFKVLDENVETTGGTISIGTMHLAKGLEFRAVAVMACDDEIIPLQDRIETVGDDADLQEVYDTERHLLYVACTRARDHLLVTGVAPVSEFLDDFTKDR